MAARKRDYRAEYARRIARGKRLGYSKRVARGHAYTGPKLKPLEKGEKRKRPVTPKRPPEFGIKAAKFVGAQPGDPIKELVLADALRVFGFPPKRGRYDPDTDKVTQRRPGESARDYFERTKGWEGESKDEYALRLAELRSGPGNFNWTREELFIAQMKAIGLNERDAYTHWFSP